jgi:hypothetical protein
MQEHPFMPHAIARSRTRAYMVAVVLKYLENLISWGDQLFRQGGIEAINQATQLYVRAARLLGDRPRSTPSASGEVAVSYRLLEGRLDEFSNAWLGMEALTEPLIRRWQGHKQYGTANLSTQHTLEELLGQLRSLGTLYFCVPHNDKLIEYWDIVEDRLFKIRNCMDINGIAMQWPLFEPPIDPRLLVQAAAAGLEISTVLDQLYAPLPMYRFNVMIARAAELAGEVKAMGSALLAALEKEDAEELALLRSKQELELFDKIKTVREEQIREAEANLTGLRESRQTAIVRYRHYQSLLGIPNPIIPAEGAPMVLQSSTLQLAPSTTLAEDERGLGMLLTEQQQLAWLGAAQAYNWISGIVNTVSSVLHALPDFEIGPVVYQADWGGSHLGHATSAVASFLNT